MDIKLFSCKDTECLGFVPQVVTDIIGPVLKKLELEPMKTLKGADITDLHEMKYPMMVGSVRCFTAPKVEKIQVGSLVFMKRMAGNFLTILPADDYDFPIFSSEFIENPGNSHFLLDIHALQDLCIDALVPRPEDRYADKYVLPFEKLWKEYADISNDVNPNWWFRAMLGPFCLTGRHKPEGVDRSNISRIVEVWGKYLDLYITQVVAKAQPITDPEQREFARKKKKAIREIYATRDPGAGPLVVVLGKEKAKKIIDCLF
jgi:hypothetical protein